MKRKTGLILPLLTLAVSTAEAAPLRDIRTGHQSSFNPMYGSDMLSAGGTAFFTINDEQVGSELWKLDASGRGVLVKDIFPGQAGSNPYGLTDVNGTLFFQVRTGSFSDELWKSDGTPAGTVPVLSPVVESVDSTPQFGDMAALGSTLLFGYGPQSGTELWRSDGTTAGTVLVKDIRPGPEGSGVSRLMPLGGMLYFLADDGTHGTELWRSDGTAAGTVLVKDIRPGAAGLSHPRGGESLPLASAGGALFLLTAADAGTLELWKTDGTSTVRLKTFSSDPSSPFRWNLELAEVQGRLFLVVNGGLWMSDGTEAGTVQVWEFSSSEWPAHLGQANGTLFFTSGGSLWKSDGTEAGTLRVKALTEYSWGVGDPREAGGTLFFVVTTSSGMALWKSDGTTAGTVKVHDFIEGTFLDGMWNVDGTLFLTTISSYGVPGIRGLWRSNGTEVGTVQVEPATPAPHGSSVESPTPLGDLTLFIADDGVHGWELWRTDGTETGTVMVKDIWPGSLSSGIGGLVATAGGKLFFSADDGVHGTELWMSDGTEAGTVMLKDIRSGSSGAYPSNLVDLGGKLFFSTDDRVHGTELWMSDGTEAGTVMLKDIQPGQASSGARGLTVALGKLFFSADDGIHGTELWMSDGTEAGTVMLKDIQPGSEGAESAGFTLINGTVFFMNDERELWKTDGTEAGTVKVKSFSQQLDVFFVQALGDTSFLFLARDEAHGDELWRSDGTEAGTVMVKDIHPGPGSSLPHAFTRVGDRLVFVAYDPEHGFEPWVTDGTGQGTHLLRDVLPGPTGSIWISNGPAELLGLEDRSLALFTATDGVQGLELWMTDGTPEGTVQVADLFPGEGSSEPRSLLRLGDKLFLVATDAEHGREPHLLALPAARDRTVPILTCPADLTVETSEASGTRVEYPQASASDIEGPPRLDYSAPSGTHFLVGTTAITVTATDTAGNRGQCTFQVNVALKPPPSVSGMPIGCGCAVTGAPDVALLWLLLALLGLATRR